LHSPSSQFRRGRYRPFANSDAPGGNVESLTLTDLSAGDYRLILTADARSYYGLAWIGGDDLSSIANPAIAREPSFLMPNPTLPRMTSEFSSPFATASPTPEPPLLLMAIPAYAFFCFRRSDRRPFPARSIS